MISFIRLHKNIIFEFSLLISAALSIVIGGINIYILLFSIAMHELGHIIMALIKGAKTKNFKIHGFGVEIIFSDKKPGPKTMLFISAGGPLMSLMLALVGYYLNNFIFFMINLSISIINLLPAYPLDGGNILFSILSIFISRSKTRRIMKISGRLIGVCIIFCGFCVLFVSSFNISLIYIGLVVLFSVNNIQNPVMEIYSNDYSAIEKCSLYTVNDNLSALEIADNLPINSIGAVKNDNGEIVSFVTPLMLYNYEIKKK